MKHLYVTLLCTTFNVLPFYLIFVNFFYSEESLGQSSHKEYQLIFVSKRSAVCEQRLKVET